MNLKNPVRSLTTRLLFVCTLFINLTYGQGLPKDLNQSWIEEHLVSDKPIIIFTNEVEEQFRSKLQT
ncbi:MAG: hypothetical protein AAF705_10490, partial [Bacteroidota bacterium]